MLDQAIFTREMTFLAERFNRELSEAVAALYFEMLSGALSTPEFVQACRQVFYGSTFFPSPAEIVAAVKGDPKDQGVVEWLELVEASNAGKRAGLSEAGQYAYKAIGGSWAMQTQDATFLKKDFLEAYRVFHDKVVRDRLPALEAS